MRLEMQWIALVVYDSDQTTFGAVTVPKTPLILMILYIILEALAFTRKALRKTTVCHDTIN